MRIACICLLVLVLLFVQPVQSPASVSLRPAAMVRNVVAAQVGNRIQFTYDLEGEGEAEVNVTVMVKGQAYSSDKLHLEGDLGRVKPGNSKKIWWNVLQDFPRGISDDVEWDVATVSKAPIISKSTPSYPKPMQNEFSSAGPWRPNKPIEFIVPMSPGGGTDIVARSVASAIERDVGQRVLIMNKPGAGGAIGTSYVAKSKPDGYTLLFGYGASTDLIMSHLEKFTQEASKSLIPVCRIATIDPMVLTVRSDSPFKTLKDFIAFGKNNPGKLTAGSMGTISSSNIILKAFAMHAGLRMQIVPYDASASALTALLGGHVDSAAISLASALPQIKANILLPIAVANNQRSPVLSTVPTFQELGFGLANTTLNYGLAAPPGTSPDVIQFFAYMLYKASVNPDFIRQMEKIGMPIGYLGPRDFGQTVSAGFEEYGRLIRQLEIKL